MSGGHPIPCRRAALMPRPAGAPRCRAPQPRTGERSRARLYAPHSPPSPPLPPPPASPCAVGRRPRGPPPLPPPAAPPPPPGKPRPPPDERGERGARRATSGLHACCTHAAPKLFMPARGSKGRGAAAAPENCTRSGETRRSQCAPARPCPPPETEGSILGGWGRSRPAARAVYGPAPPAARAPACCSPGPGRADGPLAPGRWLRKPD
jgi:hypothetical protein